MEEIKVEKLFKDKRSKDYRQFKKWVSVLRSGTYNQTKHTLQDSKGFCCLGVACKEIIHPMEQYLGTSGFIMYKDPINQDGAPRWLKHINEHFLALQEPITPFNEYMFPLTALNDDEDFSFDEIADLLEYVYTYGAWDL